MSNLPFSQRLGAFKQRFQQVLGNRGSGYDELAQLEQPLVGDDSSYGGGDDYERSHGVSAPGQYSSFGSGMGGGRGGMSTGSALPSHVNQTIPSQVRQHKLLKLKLRCFLCVCCVHELLLSPPIEEHPLRNRLQI